MNNQNYYIMKKPTLFTILQSYHTWNFKNIHLFKPICFSEDLRTNILWAEFLSDFQNVGTKIFRKVIIFEKK